MDFTTAEGFITIQNRWVFTLSDSSLIGMGSFGQVRRAFDITRHNRPVAIKMMLCTCDGEKNIELELAAYREFSTLKHIMDESERTQRRAPCPALLGSFAFTKYDDTYACIVMELWEQSLQEVIKKMENYRWDYQTTIRTLNRLVEKAFSKARKLHTMSIFHMDLRCMNVLLNLPQKFAHNPAEVNHADVRIIDFGLSQIFQNGEPRYQSSICTERMVDQTMTDNYDLTMLSFDVWIMAIVYNTEIRDSNAMPWDLSPLSETTIKAYVARYVTKGLWSYGEPFLSALGHDAQQRIREGIESICER